MKVLEQGDDIWDDEQLDRTKESVFDFLEKAYGCSKSAMTRGEIADLIAQAGEGSDKDSEESDAGDSVDSEERDRELQRKSEGGSDQGSLFGFSNLLIASAKPAAKPKPAARQHVQQNRNLQQRLGVTTPNTDPAAKPLSKQEAAPQGSGKVKGKSKSKSKEQGQGSQVRHMDGRMERLETNVKDEWKNIDKQFGELKQMLCDCNDDKGGHGKDFQTSVRTIINKAKDLGTDIKSATTRITRSKADHDMSEHTDNLKVLRV